MRCGSNLALGFVSVGRTIRQLSWTAQRAELTVHHPAVDGIGVSEMPKYWAVFVSLGVDIV